jgi:hypothetical protein
LESLSAEIDNAVEDLFGIYTTTPQEPASSKKEPTTQQPVVQPTPAVAVKPIQTAQPAARPAAQAAPPTSEKSGLHAEIDKAVDDLFGAYDAPQQTAAPQQEAPALELSLEIEEIPTPPGFAESVAIQPAPAATVKPIQTAQPAARPAAPAPPTTEKSGLHAEIDKAVDDLFGAYDAPQQTTIPQQAAPAFEPIMGMEELPEPSIIDESVAAQEVSFSEDMPTGSLWELLDQSFLTIDWEVSSTNVRAAKRILDTLRTELNIDRNKESKQVALLMDQILVAMARSPENVPTSGPQALKIALNALKAGHENFDTAKDLINKATTALKSALPEMPAEGHIVTAPAGAAGLLQNHVAFLAKCIKNIASFEKIFSQKSAHKKLHNAETKIKNNLENQAAKISAVTKKLLSSGSTELTSETANIIAPHIAVLQQCSKNVFSIETLFANKDALKKVYNVHQKMRLSLDKQIQALNRLISSEDIPTISGLGPSGEKKFGTPQEFSIPIEIVVDEQRPEKEIQSISSFISIDESTGSPEIEISTTPSIPETFPGPSRKSSCPWKNLVTAEWQGKAVAFIPSEVAFEERANSWVKKRHEKLTSLPVRKLKKHFWSKLGNLFRGEMKFLGETYLKHMEIPILNHVGAYRDTTKTPKKPILLVLFNEGYGGSVILKTPTKSFSVSKSWNWQPINQKGSILAGYLNAKGKSLPVITVSQLE